MMNKAAINIIGFESCCSCGLCQNTCPFNAITMAQDDNGFFRPYIKKDLCTNCGLCAKTCPIIKKEPQISQNATPQIVGCWSNDYTNVINSSSGGISFELAKAFIECGGYVCGVQWNNGVPVFEIATTINQLQNFRGSKYLQPDPSDIYKKIHHEIRNGHKVLFLGLPCHVQAISNYIKSDNLFCVDLVCAGVPSMLMYKKYCSETFGNEKITHVRFRAKEVGKPEPWRRYSLEFYSREYLLKREYHGKNPFFLAFNSTKVYNQACYTCEFNTIPRRGDLTLCDYWGVNSDKENINGTSLVLINSPRGEGLFNELTKKPGIISTIEVVKKEALEGTKRINLSSRNIPSNYNQIFKTLQKKGFYAMYKRYIKPSLLTRIFRRLGLVAE